MPDIFKPKARTNEHEGPRAALKDIPEEKTDVDPDLQPNEAQVIQTTTTEQDKKCDDILCPKLPHFDVIVLKLF